MLQSLQEGRLYQMGNASGNANFEWLQKSPDRYNWKKRAR